jgi:hypothetical protein
MAAAFLFAGQYGGEEQSGEQQRANLMEISGGCRIVMDVFDNLRAGQNPVEQPSGGQRAGGFRESGEELRVSDQLEGVGHARDLTMNGRIRA